MFQRRSIVIALSCLAAGLPAWAQKSSLTASGERQIGALLAEKATRTPAQLKLDSQLHYAAKMRRGLPIAEGIPTLPGVESSLETAKDGRVHVDIDADVTPELLAAITGLGGRVENHFAEYHSIRAWIPLLAAETLAGRSDVWFIRPASRANAGGGPDVEGVAAHAASTVQLAGYLGQGVKVCILSTGVDSLSAEQSAGRLPAVVTILPGQAGSGDEGTAMLEIVYSMAPSAQLYFATGTSGVSQMADNITSLWNNYQCDVIADDINSDGEPVFQDGVVAKAINTVTSAGALYFSSAGNYGNLATGNSGTWEGDFVDSGQSISNEQGTLHSFAGSDYDAITSPSGYGAYFLQWSDPWSASCNDYDLFILNSTSTKVLASSTNRQNCARGSFPWEGFCAASSETTCKTKIPANSRVYVVNYKGAAATRALHLGTQDGILSVGTTGSTFAHNAAAAAVTVAATSAKGLSAPFTGGSANPPENYSSDGPRRIFYDAGGNAITPGNLLFSTNGGQLLSKVDIMAADCITTGLTPMFAPFCGTSAAAPHAAAIAALVKSQNPTWTAAMIKNAMVSTVLPVSYSTDVAGAGIVMASTSTGVYPLQITSLSTNMVFVNQNTTITLTGAGFQPGFAVYIEGAPGSNDIPVTTTYIDQAHVKVTFKIPSNTAGFADGLTVQNPDGQQAQAILQVIAGIPESGAIGGSVTWKPKSLPYVIANTLTIPAGATLTISPGTVIKMVHTSGPILDVQGTLTANGTASLPITITSLNDCSIGGFTGGNCAPATGDWSEVRFEPGSSGSLTHVNILYGGSAGSSLTLPTPAVDIATGSTNPTVDHDIFTSCGIGLLVEGGSSTTVTQSSFQQNTVGLQVTSGLATVSGTTFLGNGTGVAGGTVSLTGDGFSGNTVAAISIATGGGGSITKNTITTAAGGDGIDIPWNFAGTISGNKITGAGNNGLAVSGTITANTTWSETAVPYVVKGILSVQPGVTLTISPGAVVKFQAVPKQLAGLDIRGALIANGTTALPITFTSYLDDTVGGNTDGAGGTTPNPADWSSLRFEAGSSGSLTHAVVRYAGGIFDADGDVYAAVDIGTESTAPTLSSDTIANNVTGMAIDVDGTNTTIANTSFQANAVGLSVTGGSATVTGGTFLNNGYGVQGGPVNLSGIGFAGNTTAAISITSGSITKNTITTVNGADAIDVPATFSGAISGNKIVGGGDNGIVVSGTLSGNVTWSASGTPYVIGNGGLTVPAGSSLTISPGAVVKFMPSFTTTSYIFVQGGFIANGTATKPIVFTSFLDQTFGGVTNGDGNTTTGNPGDWAGIHFEPGATGSISYAQILYGGGTAPNGPTYAAVDVATGSSAPTVSNDTFLHNVTAAAFTAIGSSSKVTGSFFTGNGTAIHASNRARPVVNNCYIEGNGFGEQNDSTLTLNATNNYWGSANGPSGAGPGSGDAVSAYVNFTPFLTSYPNTVPGTANPYLAAAPAGTQCCGGDAAPAESPVHVTTPFAPGDKLTFIVTGSVNYGGGAPIDPPDGSGIYTSPANLGIAAYTGPADALVGVFLNGAPPATAPAGLDFSPSGLGTGFTTLSPALGQVFFIGDGLTGTGSGQLQTFVVPAGATDLYLAASDGEGWYNNSGFFTVTMTVKK